MTKSKIHIPETLRKFNAIFEARNFKAYLVGGAVRDIFLGKTPSDWDVATNATPQDVMSMFRFVVPTGIEHGTVTVHFMREEIEVTTFRTESGYSDGRRPDSVNYAATIEEDLSRRDFTMNAIAVSLADGSVTDPYGGRADIKNRIIRTVGCAHERFMEDGLRPIRAVRFAGSLGFSIEKLTYKELFNGDVQQKTASISSERFRDELEKIIMTAKPSASLEILEETGILWLFIPEFRACRGCVQADRRAFHKFDVLDHLFYSCDGAAKITEQNDRKSKLTIRLAALFHDIGKPEVRKIVLQDVMDESGVKKSAETITFYNHESAGERITGKLMARLKFSNEMTGAVCHLVREHMFHYESAWSDAAVRRFIIRVGLDRIDDLFALRLSDMFGMRNDDLDLRGSEPVRLLDELRGRISAVMESRSALSLKDLAVNGRDLIAMGIPPGKKIGAILNELMGCVIEDPQMNTRERLLEVAKKISGEYNKMDERD